MKATALRELSREELIQKLSSLKKELFDFRMQASAGKLDKPHHIEIVRKDVARVLTVLNQLEQQEKKPSVSPDEKKGSV